MSEQKKKGFSFRPKATPVELAPPELADLPNPTDEAVSIKPSPMTSEVKSSVRGMFGAPAPGPAEINPQKLAAVKPMFASKEAKGPQIVPFLAEAKKAVATAAQVPTAAQLRTTEKYKETFASELEKLRKKEPLEAVAEEGEQEPEATLARKEAKKAFDLEEAEQQPKEDRRLDFIESEEMAGDETLKIIGREYVLEEKQYPYVNPEPDYYVPETRRGFSKFIRMTYEDFMLKPVGESEPVAPGDKFPYQKFVREYMRQSSPYRGILVYHGLGSGKTCTAIATSEALFSTANKKIIVMTPFSLQKNFLKEISFCGFRHYRLKNFWVPLNKQNPTHRLFALQVLGLSESYIRTAKSLWVPDFKQAESNYDTLSAEDQEQIRKQILSQLIWHREKNPGGRIRFINYNGITARRLKEIACSEKQDFFDDAVIVIDEIHNLVRLIQGTVDYWLEGKPMKKDSDKRRPPREVVGTEKWRPGNCMVDDKKYKRGYYFYRLLLAAKRSKIIGLSGTPLINFPEEIGILSNILHGYIPVVRGIVNQTGLDAEKRLKEIGMEHPYTDFVDVQKSEGAVAGTLVNLSLLPEGIRKVPGVDEGVERIPPEEEIPGAEDIKNSIIQQAEGSGFTFYSPLKLESLSLLPPYFTDFAKYFLDANYNLQNKVVLTKRLTGLISYYKGSRQDLMPSSKDIVVYVPLSPYAQQVYSVYRKEEIDKEDKTKKKQKSLMDEIEDISKMKQSSNYKMSSRQACNFVFPESVMRPRPDSARDQETENVNDADILDTSPDVGPLSPEEDEDYDFPEADELIEGDDNEDEAQAEDEAIEAAQEAEEAAEEVKEGGMPPPPSAPVKMSLAELKRRKAERNAAAAAAKGAVSCKEPLEGENYKDACVRAKECLVREESENLKLGPLEKYSPKMNMILKNILEAPGSSLLYSQFLSMEGIGIFRIIMDINGFAPIEIENTPRGPAFSKRTEESFRKGPGGQMRYITFSGEETEDIRRLALDVFNAKFDELPGNLRTVLQESGYVNNHMGEICRVFCITSAGSEGLSLKNVRAVHIMEPYWNDVRIKQVKGRAIRIGSHLELPEDQRNVMIYNYVSCFSDESQQALAGAMLIDATIRGKDAMELKEAASVGFPIPPKVASYIVTSDQRLYYISQRKKKVLEDIEQVMKTAAVDCQLNMAENRDGKYQCLDLEKMVGDFLYEPDLAIDITKSLSRFRAEKRATVAFTRPKDGKDYFAVIQYDAQGNITEWFIYGIEDKEMQKVVAKAEVKMVEGEPKLGKISWSS